MKFLLQLQYNSDEICNKSNTSLKKFILQLCGEANTEFKFVYSRYTNQSFIPRI